MEPGLSLNKDIVEVLREKTKLSAKDSNSGVLVCFDVDGTIIDYDGNPIAETIQLFKLLQKFGCTMFIWSAAGENYAKAISRWLKLEANVVKKGSIVPDIAFDDNEFDLGKVNIRVPGREGLSNSGEKNDGNN